MEPSDVLEALHRCRCAMEKAEVPEAASARGTVLSLLKRAWSSRVEAAEDVAVEAVEGFENASLEQEDEGNLEAILALVLLEVTLELRAPFTTRTRKALGAAARALLLAGARGSGEFSLEAGRGPAALNGAVYDLAQIIQGHVARAEPKIRENLRSFLVSPEVRADRARWRADLRQALDAEGVFLRSGADTWAYRTFNIGRGEGAVAAALQGTGRLVVVNNPPNGPDGKTTPFCRWVHGREVETFRVTSFLDNYRAALSSGDPAQAIAAWPLELGVKSQTIHDHINTFERLPLPPYHFFCRTVVESV